MNYLEVIKRSFQIIWQNKFLWIFGFFLGGALGGGFNFGSGNKFQQSEDKDKEALEQLFWQGRDFFYTHFREIITIAIVVGLILLLFIILMIVLRVFSRGALVKASNQLDDEMPTTFKQSLHQAKPYFWKILGLGIIFSIIKFFLFIIPFMLFLFGLIFTLSQKGTWPILILLGISAFCLFIISLLANILIGLIQKYASCFLILKDQKVIESIEAGIKLFRTFWKQSALMWLWLFLIGIGVSFALLLGILVIAIPFVLLGIILTLIFKTAGLIIAISLGILGLVVFMVVARGGIGAYFETVWVLTFKRLFKKTEEETSV